MIRTSRSGILWSGVINGVDLLLVDDILGLDAHALGCYSSTSLTLHSVIAQELIARGGASIRAEAQKHGPAAVGDVITLPGGKLRSAYVLAAVTNRLHSTPALADVSVAVAALLARAASLDARSLALPLLRIKRQIQPEAMLRATLAPIIDHLSGATSLRQIAIGVQDDDATLALNLAGFLSTVCEAMAELGAWRARIAALADVRSRLARVGHGEGPAVVELLQAELDLRLRVRDLLERELRAAGRGGEGLGLELDGCAQGIAELERQLAAAGTVERTIGD